MIAWSISIVDINLILKVVLFVMITLNLFQFVVPEVMVDLFCFNLKQDRCMIEICFI